MVYRSLAAQRMAELELNPRSLSAGFTLSAQSWTDKEMVPKVHPGASDSSAACDPSSLRIPRTHFSLPLSFTA